MKLILISNVGIQPYCFNKDDSQKIIALCKNADKQWSESLLGFFINTISLNPYVAITIKNAEGEIESMEYVDIDTQKPEIFIDNHFVSSLIKKDINAEIDFAEFEPILKEIVAAPLKARKWEIYHEITKQYPSMH